MTRRGNTLNVVVALLASFALVSVSTDVYAYLSGEGSDLIALRQNRGELLLGFLTVLALTALLIVLLFSPGTGRRR